MTSGIVGNSVTETGIVSVYTKRVGLIHVVAELRNSNTVILRDREKRSRDESKLRDDAQKDNIQE